MSIVKSAVLGIGMAVPSKVLTNFDLEKMVETSDKWITERTGIKERRILEDEENISQYTIKASLEALERAKVSPEELNLIICATVTPDYLIPSLSVLVQEGIKAVNAGAFDLSATCSGFIYGLAVADQFIKNNPDWKILVIGAEALSRKTNWKDRTICVLLGDGAGAVVMGMSPEPEKRGIIDIFLGADGSQWPLLTLKGGGSCYPPFDKRLPEEEYYIKMQGREVFKVATRMMEKIALELLKRNDLTNKDIKLLVPHQANLRIIEYLRERLNLPKEKVYVNIHKYGNTSAASIPLALYEAEKEGKLKEGDLVLLVAFGGGFTFGGALLRW
ncbi:MAG: 3-oxoacyl-[acyl-carrier-protein] synthase III [Thermodesulfobacterium sp.]|uniref:Beta-ketoacyl-[acyl-carrier-protein] synthase III n=1 Tax=Candidatus Thermodesulfobacterium syntrophicum TaxID=3060442 RepID=A0AAE3TFV8_9BACT|nr:3-oxoacyl-[acyl-carrier-protein] synthase III [Candidatus Thermodesulfobacterium syntrophicum]